MSREDYSIFWNGFPYSKKEMNEWCDEPTREEELIPIIYSDGQREDNR